MSNLNIFSFVDLVFYKYLFQTDSLYFDIFTSNKIFDRLLTPNPCGNHITPSTVGELNEVYYF